VKLASSIRCAKARLYHNPHGDRRRELEHPRPR
jgi:hypothetical protein